MYFFFLEMRICKLNEFPRSLIRNLLSQKNLIFEKWMRYIADDGRDVRN